jgi:hypothetical protein
MVQPPDHLGHHRHHLGVRVPENRAHLATREVEHPPTSGVLHEGTRRPLGDERHERPPVANQMTSCSRELPFIRHRQILA